MEKFENPIIVKKSFELRYQNDDDDEIYITNELDENTDRKDSLFLMEPNFEDENKKSRKSSGSPTEFEKINMTNKDLEEINEAN